MNNKKETDALFATLPQLPSLVRAGEELMINVKKVVSLDRVKRTVEFENGETRQVENEYWENFIQVYDKRDNL